MVNVLGVAVPLLVIADAMKGNKPDLALAGVEFLV
jgi:hypothetical protein